MDLDTLRHLQQSVVLSCGMPFHPAQVQHPPSASDMSPSEPSSSANTRADWPSSLLDHWWYGQSQSQNDQPKTPPLLESKSLPPLLRLPPELLSQILSYVLPQTFNLRRPSSRRPYGSDVVWRLNSISMLSTCKILHDASVDFLYGNNTFVLRTRFDGTEFQFKRLKGDLVPTTTPLFPAFFAAQHICRLRKLVLFVEIVDDYTGTIKYGYGSRGQVAGVQSQVAILTKELKECDDLVDLRVVLDISGADVVSAADVLGPLQDLSNSGTRVRVIYLQRSQSKEVQWP